MQKLTDGQVAQVFEKLPKWQLQEGKLVRVWVFADFVAAMDFVNRVATLAEEAGHHPDIDVRYNKVTLGLVTHDAGGITAKDASMATRLDSLT